MNHHEDPRKNRFLGRKKDTETMDLLKEVFVCVSIPTLAFAFAYITLHALIGLFLG